MSAATLQGRLRARVVPVPRPGTSPRLVPYGTVVHGTIGGPPPKPGDDAGELQVMHPWGGAALGYYAQPHVWATEPLCAEAAEVLDRATELARLIHQTLKRGPATVDHGLLGDLACVLDHVADGAHPGSLP